YEQVTTSTLLGIVEELDSPHVGICLDPANCVSALEHPKDVVEACAPRTVNLHVKDFAFARQEGWVGFTYSGAPLGEGLLDLDHELRHVYSGDRSAPAAGRAPSAIVEHWLPWQGDLATTLETERAWTDRTLAALRDWREAHRPSPASPVRPRRAPRPAPPSTGPAGPHPATSCRAAPRPRRTPRDTRRPTRRSHR